MDQEQTYDLSNSHDSVPSTGETGLGILVRKNDTGIYRLEDLRSVCLKRGPTAKEIDAVLDGLQHNIQTRRSFGDDSDALAAYDEGTYDGFAAPISTLDTLRKKLSDPDDHVILGIPRAKQIMMSELTIPVQIDSIKRLEQFQRTRCTYFRVELEDEPIVKRHPVLPEVEALLAWWGNWAVLAGPDRFDANGRFYESGSVDKALRSIENTEGLFLELSYIWLPNESLGLEGPSNDVRRERGDVYRLPTPVFRQCYQFGMDVITEEEWLDSCRSYSEAIRFSDEETSVFRDWRQEQIQQSRDLQEQTEYFIRRLPKEESEE